MRLLEFKEVNPGILSLLMQQAPQVNIGQIIPQTKGRNVKYIGL